MRLPAICNRGQSRALARGSDLSPTPTIRLVAKMRPLDTIKCDYDATECDWDAIRDAICFLYELRHIRHSYFIFIMEVSGDDIVICTFVVLLLHHRYLHRKWKMLSQPLLFGESSLEEFTPFRRICLSVWCTILIKDV